MERQETLRYGHQALAEATANFMRRTYAWMVGGITLTAIIAWYVYSSGVYLSIVGGGLFYVLIFGQLGLVIGLSAAINKISKTVAGILFIAYSALTGVTFSVILAAFEMATVINVFFVAAAMFAGISFYGFVTKRSLNAIGSFVMTGLIGLIVAIVINIFVQSSALEFLISVAGVLIFAGLTAYDTQKLKEMAAIELENGEAAGKASILGALTLYLDFINLFLFLLRLIGGRK